MLVSQQQKLQEEIRELVGDHLHREIGDRGVPLLKLLQDGHQRRARPPVAIDQAADLLLELLLLAH